MAKTITEKPTKTLSKRKSKTDIAEAATVQEAAPAKSKPVKTKGKEKEDAAPAPISTSTSGGPVKKTKKTKKAEEAVDAEPVVAKETLGKKAAKRKADAEEPAKEQKVAKRTVAAVPEEAKASKTKKAEVEEGAAKGKKGKKSKAADEKGADEEGAESAAPSSKAKAAKTKVADSAPVSVSPPKKAKKSKVAKPASPEPDEEEAFEDGEKDQDEDSMHMFGFSTDEDDSSDDEAMNEDDAPGIDVKKLPTIAKDDATVKQRLEKAKRKPTADRGVIYLGRIPHGFYEDQMRSYFGQFGDVTRLRLSRNKQTGRSKHYAFIEFESASVAQIVADTMDNYLLMGHILTCKTIPKDEVHAELWVGANRKWRKVPQDRISRLEHNKPRTEQEQNRAEKRLLKRQAEKKRKLAEAGIDYDFDAISYKKKPKPTEA
ncbi:hypothetical protein EIP91_008124 [Steccherinum ochraceum]|uniref:RRM domain-containing protein n=1 Tax=Steccherinum ochraceum TaxID=92696 RepID=A0A4R0R910_9APHY|nr:hypothetical protein EIP91_008124 [Steccherinum ochraceum]